MRPPSYMPGTGSRWVQRTVIGVLFVLGAYLTFEFGRLQARYNVVDAAAERREFAQRIAGIEDTISDLKQEVALLETELREAEQRLAAVERTRHEMLVVAERDGVVDRVDVSLGSVVEKDTALLGYFDPSTARIVAYAKSGDAFDVDPGAECTVVYAGRRERSKGRVLEVGGSLRPMPPPLAAGPASPPPRGCATGRGSDRSCAPGTRPPRRGARGPGPAL